MSVSNIQTRKETLFLSHSQVHEAMLTGEPPFPFRPAISGLLGLGPCCHYVATLGESLGPLAASSAGEAEAPELGLQHWH